MPREITIKVLRYDPEKDISAYWREYSVPHEQKNTILGALLYLQEKIDPTLAFRYGCRYKRCGLCALEVDGKPRMACHTYLKNNMSLGPLSKLPLVRDLVIDRKGFFADLVKHELYIEKDEVQLLTIIEPKQGARLRSCAECLSCLAACLEYSFANEIFGGPYLFVKLAQLHFDPRNQKNRLKQAQKLGIDRCRDCKKCYCPNGIQIYRDAIRPLLRSR